MNYKSRNLIDLFFVMKNNNEFGLRKELVKEIIDFYDLYPFPSNSDINKILVQSLKEKHSASENEIRKIKRMLKMPKIEI